MGKPQSAAVVDEMLDHLATNAEQHKRLSRQHRDLARRNVELLRQLRAWCIENGLPVERVVTARRGDG